MYCHNCGAETNEILSTCAYCGTSLANVQKMISAEKSNILASMFPDLSNCKGFKINFLEHDICYDWHYEMLSKTNLIFEHVTDILYKEFEEYIGNITSLDSLISDGCKKGYELLLDMENMSVAFLNKYCKDKKISMTQFNTHIRIYSDVRIQELNYIITAINHAAEMAKEERERQHAIENSRQSGVWVGGGFGIKGALHGMINAAVLNAGTSIFRQTSSSIKKYLQNSIDNNDVRKLKQELISAGEIQKEMLCVFKELCTEISMKSKKILMPRLNISEDRYHSKLLKVKNYILSDPEDINGCIDDIIYLLSRDPFNVSFYKAIYSYKHGKYGKQLSNIAMNFFDQDKLQRVFLESDKKILEENMSKIEDTDEMSVIKWKNLHEIELNNPVYFNDRFSLDKSVLAFKDNMFQLWSRFCVKLMNKKLNEAATILENIELDDAWISIDKNPPVQYFVYQNTMYEFRDIIFNRDIETFMEESADLRKRINAKSDTALCIWSAIMVKLSIKRNQNADKYQDTIKTLAGKGNVLAASILGEYYMNGIGICKQDQYIAERILRKLVWKSSPLAIAYFGKFYANGEYGYEKNPILAEEFLKCGKTYMVPFAETQLKKLVNK